MDTLTLMDVQDYFGDEYKIFLLKNLKNILKIFLINDASNIIVKYLDKLPEIPIVIPRNIYSNNKYINIAIDEHNCAISF